MEKAPIDLWTSEAIERLTLVCLSRAKQVVDLLVEPTPFSRLSQLSEELTLRLRLVREERPKALVVMLLSRQRGIEEQGFWVVS